jgi:tryptophan halogenase
MSSRINNVVVLGGGSAGFLSALAVRRLLPGWNVTVVHSSNVPVIGVGESTTRAVPHFLHNTLGLDRKEFYHDVRPIWKLGNRLVWGSPQDTHFNYPFDSFLPLQNKNLRMPHMYYCLNGMSDCGHYYSMMDQGRAPMFVENDGQCFVDENFGYHIDNRRFLAHLKKKTEQAGVELLDADVATVQRSETGDVTHLLTEDGRQVEADLFVDCSGFRSLLLKQTLGERYVDYTDTLFCDTAVVGTWPREDDDVLPLTTTETMEHGWCWKIEFEDQITRGYVFASQFCTEDEAIREMKSKNPLLGDDLRVIRFPSGRYENFWVKNVVAIGNASGFVEPLEATALQLIVEQLRFVCQALNDSDGEPSDVMRQVENRRYRGRWDDVRDFLAVHYKFNRRSDSPFWQHCRADTKLGAAEEFVEYYQKSGPSPLANLLADQGMFGFEGYMTMLLGQRVPTERPVQLTDQDQADWDAFRAHVRWRAAQALSMREALGLFNRPDFQWPETH